jgi:hypothetical protein
MLVGLRLRADEKVNFKINPATYFWGGLSFSKGWLIRFSAAKRTIFDVLIIRFK